jgi:segregation and condensation protein A
MADSDDTVQTQPKTHQDLHFKLAVFEGPLDLLLHLIKENKIDIYDIPIAKITKQYLEYIDLMKELSLEIAGEFLVMAATLVQIKSKMLLPPDEKEAEEPAEDPRAELVQRLLEYKSFKETSSEFREKESIWRNIFNRMPPQIEEVEIGPELSLFEVSLFDLLTAFKDILSKAPEEVIEITREKLTVSDKINFIMEKLEGSEGIKFEDIFLEGSTKIILVITFLALLELVRLGLVKAYQEHPFGSIWIINPQKMTAGQNTEIRSPDLLSDTE